MYKVLIISSIIMILLLIVACRDNVKDEAKEKISDANWWQSLKPDLVVGSDEFYAKKCTVTKVDVHTGEGELVFRVPTNFLETCTHRDDVLTYDGEYIILDVCVMAFGAGGCSGGRYRSADYRNWEEEIGITWINEEPHEAWRKVGSKSSKADSVKRIAKE